MARLGGDEFCVLITDATSEQELLRTRLINAFSTFNETGGRPYRLSASIGLMLAPAMGSASVDELLARADGLMYVEKKTRVVSRP